MKTSSITFLTLAFSLIIFSAFIAAFPDGINFAKKHSIIVDDGNMVFYGGMLANGNLEIYARNASLYYNNDSINITYMKFKGYGNFYFPSILYVNGIAYADELNLNATGYANIDGNETYGKFMFKLEGGAAINFTKFNASFFTAKKEFGIFIESTNIGNEEDVKKILTMLRLLPISINKVFYISDGNGTIDGIITDFNKLIFRGDAILDGKLNASSYLVINNKKFFENEKKVNLKLFSIPFKIVVLWLVAISIFIISLFVKREQKEFDKSLYGSAIIIGILFLAISFYLWEKQAAILFGRSLFAFLNERSFGSILGIVFMLIPYMEFIALIAFPIRIAISSAFSLFGLSNAGRIAGRSIGYIAGIWLGIKLLPAILNMVFSPLLSII